MTKSILEIADFGAIDAESDKRLSEFFVTTPTYDELIGQGRYVAIGRKGTGKSALYQALEGAKNDATFVTGLVFGDYPWSLHDHVLNRNASAQERFVNSWQFLILVELAKLAIQDETDDRGRRDAVKGLTDFVTANWGTLKFSHKDFFRLDQYEIATEFNPSIAGTSLAKVSRRKVERAKLGDSLGETLKWLEGSLTEALVPDHRYFVLFDELDRNFDPRDESYVDRLTGLLLAARNVAIWSDMAGQRARATVFLRSDIFELLKFADKNKIRDNAVVEVRWTDDTRGGDSLMALMNQRIRVALELNGDGDPWDVAFESAEVMRGTQSKYKHMTTRTYLRPRDMIKFSNLALSTAQGRLRKAAAREGRISNEDIADARVPYSQYLTNELDDEIGATHKGWKEYLELVRRIGTVTFSKEELQTQYDAWVADLKALLAEILGLLYDYSIVGFLARGGRGGGAETVFRYSSPDVSLDPSAGEFRVHPGLKEALGLKER